MCIRWNSWRLRHCDGDVWDLVVRPSVRSLAQGHDCYVYVQFKREIGADGGFSSYRLRLCSVQSVGFLAASVRATEMSSLPIGWPHVRPAEYGFGWLSARDMRHVASHGCVRAIVVPTAMSPLDVIEIAALFV